MGHQSENLIIITIYRSCNSTEENKKLLNLINEINDIDVKYRIMCGDFNVPGIDWEYWTIKHGSVIFSHDFIETVTDG